jgi:hypothetical protein
MCTKIKAKIGWIGIGHEGVAFTWLYETVVTLFRENPKRPLCPGVFGSVPGGAGGAAGQRRLGKTDGPVVQVTWTDQALDDLEAICR